MKVAILDRVAPQASAFERAAFAAVLAKTEGLKNGETMEEIAEKRWPRDHLAHSVTKAVQTPGATGTSGWSSQIAGDAFGGFLESLAPHSAMAMIMPRGQLSVFTGHGGKKHPYRSSAPAPMSWIEEGAAIPVTSYTLAQASLTPKKMAMLTIFSRELVKYGDAEAVFGQIFREDAGLSLDSAYLGAQSATNARHAGLLNGVAAQVAPVVSPAETLAHLAGVVAAHGSGEVVFVTSPERAARLPILSPESKTTILPSAAVPGDRVIAIDPRGLVHGYGPAPDLDVSTEGVVHMSDTPLEIVPDNGSIADPVRSLFQTDAIGLRCFIEIAFAKRRSNAVAFMDNIGW